LYNRALIYNDIRDYDKALADLDKVIAAYPEFAGAFSLRSEIFRNKGDLRKAEADYNKVQALIHTPVAVRQHDAAGDDLASSSIAPDTGENDEPSVREETQEQVAARFTSLLTIDNNTDPDQEFNNKSIRGKVQDRNITIEIEPMFTLSFYSSPNELAESTYFNKEVDDLNATRMLRFLVMITNREPQLSDENGIKKHFESIEYYNSLISSRTPRAIDYFGRAMDFMTIRNYRSAIDDLDKALALTPDFTLGYFLRSIARYRLMQAERSSIPTDASPAELQALSQNIKLSMTNIMADLDKAIELSPRFAMAYFNKGNMLLEGRDYTSALSAYNKAIEHKPDLGEAYYNRGYVYFRLGNKEAGSADLSKAGELGILPSYNLLKRMGN
nr:tetratricopeptide repeat protein [Muribaculaceae bacterium]